MRVLVACEESGVVREAFRRRGHDAWSCDLLESRIPGQHYVCDALEAIERERWDLVIAHPPCTRLCVSGVRWLHERDLWDDMREAASFFKDILECDTEKVAVENPIMHRHAREIVGRGPDQYVQPWQFGHGECKKTGLWLKGLPKLEPTNVVEGREARIHKMPDSKGRSRRRSETYQGIADAMASQWG